MSNSRWPHTRTLARLYAAQGHFEQASEIYRRLVADAPGDKALADEFDAFEKTRQHAVSKGSVQLTALFAQWIELLVRARFFSSKNGRA
ncbi:MAG: tetratricopeptide repeat protein [Desulfobacterales bacterium]